MDKVLTQIPTQVLETEALSIAKAMFTGAGEMLIASWIEHDSDTATKPNLAAVRAFEALRQEIRTLLGLPGPLPNLRDVLVN